MTNVTIQDQNNVIVQVEPQPNLSLTIDRGIAGPAGPNAIGNYGFSIQSLAVGDVLQFGGAAWVNTPQTEITDGGNF